MRFTSYTGALAALVVSSCWILSACASPHSKNAFQRLTVSAGDVCPMFPLFTPSGSPSDVRANQDGRASVTLLLPAVARNPESSTKEIQMTSSWTRLFCTFGLPSERADATATRRIVVISSAGQLDTANKNIASGTELFWDKRHSMLSRIGLASSSFPMLMTVDQSGFIRSLKKLESMEALRNALSVPTTTSPVEVGMSAPDFSMPDMNGQIRRLSDSRGKKNVLLTFFPKCFTSGCTSHLTSLQEAADDLRKVDVETWAISVDPADGEKGQRAFAASLGLEFPLIPDTGRNLSMLYGATQSANQFAARMSVLIDKRGIVRFIDKQINIHTHGADIAVRVRELGMAPP